MCNVKSKKCTECGENKPLTEFHKKKGAKDGLKYICKSCSKEKRRKRYQENKEYEDERNRKYRQENKEALNERRRNYRQENREAVKEYYRKYYQKNKGTIKERNREHYEKNRDAINERKRNYYQENKDYFKRYHKERYSTDPKYRTSRLLRKQTQRLGDFKNTNTIKLVGCSANEFWLMNGLPSIEELQELHIDHIVPMSWFDLSNEDHVKVCNHYLNLQYLSSADNLSKNARYAGSPNNMLGYKDEFDVDAYVSDTLARIEELDLHNHKNYNICLF